MCRRILKTRNVVCTNIIAHFFCLEPFFLTFYSLITIFFFCFCPNIPSFFSSCSNWMQRMFATDKLWSVQAMWIIAAVTILFAVFWHFFLQCHLPEKPTIRMFSHKWNKSAIKTKTYKIISFTPIFAWQSLEKN